MSDAQQGLAPDCLQRALRSRFPAAGEAWRSPTRTSRAPADPVDGVSESMRPLSRTCERRGIAVRLWLGTLAIAVILLTTSVAGQSQQAGRVSRIGLLSSASSSAGADRCGSGFWGRPASESGTLRHGDGAHGRSDRCRRSFVLQSSRRCPQSFLSDRSLAVGGRSWKTQGRGRLDGSGFWTRRPSRPWRVPFEPADRAAAFPRHALGWSSCPSGTAR